MLEELILNTPPWQHVGLAELYVTYAMDLAARDARTKEWSRDSTRT